MGGADGVRVGGEGDGAVVGVDEGDATKLMITKPLPPLAAVELEGPYPPKLVPG